MAWGVYLNEVDLSTIGCYVTALPAWSAPGREFPSLGIPGRQGAVLAADPVVSARVLTIEGAVVPAAGTIAARRTAEDQLKAAAMRGLVSISVDDDVTAPRRIDAVCTACDIIPRGHPTSATVSNFALRFFCPDPTWQDVMGQVVGFTSTATAIPLGTAPVGGIVQITAPSWSADVDIPVLSYVNAGGVTVGSLTFGGVTGVNDLQAGLDYLEIDLDRATVTRYDSGVASNGISLLTAGDFFTLDPMDGDPLNASSPMLKITATGGMPSGLWLGTRRWL